MSVLDRRSGGATLVRRSRSPEDPARSRLRAEATEWPRLAYLQELGGNLRSMDSVADDWPHVETKAMLIGGVEDGPDFPELARNAVAMLPNAELFLIPNVGHNPHEEAPEVFNAALIRFLDSDPNAPAGEGPSRGR